MDSIFLDSLPGLAALALITCLAAAVNSVAGGGTILTFPVLVAILPASPAIMVTANATSTIGLWPGAIAAAWAYRDDRADQPSWARWLVVPSLAGAMLGAVLVFALPPHWFALLVPWLILGAAMLFALQPQLSRLTAQHEKPAGSLSPRRLFLACGLQFLVAIYGGYFGAGIGILMLALLGSFQLGNIHKLNAVKNNLGMLVNGAAAGLFAVGSGLDFFGLLSAGSSDLASRQWLAGSGSVSWLHVFIMAVSAVIGGLVGSRLARRLPAAIVRRFVAFIGFALAGYYYWAA
ncbi:MAG: sulfite exporter TauE/SafE family protein [Planctomycetia bacterium]|nr:sulfite exporter TauE/SafE family protein [Planctomycetia bacterium]